MWPTNSTSTVLDAVNVSYAGVIGPPTTYSSPGGPGVAGGRHISVAGQAVITAMYVVGVAGNAAALTILSRSETARNRKQTLMLRCLTWNNLIALLGMLVQMHLTLYPPSSLYPHPPPVNIPPTVPPGFADSSAGGADRGWDPSQESPADWEDWEVDGIELAEPILPFPAASPSPLLVTESSASSPPPGVILTPSAKDSRQPGSGHAVRALLPSKNTARFLCMLRVVWRLFGLGSGCIAIVMAVERWLALTRPFLYQKHVTYNIIKRSIFSLWAGVLLLVFLPFLGFGVYFEPETRTCVRYKMATLPKDIAYAYVFFTFGTLLCICIACCNLAVIRVLCRVGLKGRSVVRRISRNSLKTSSYSMGVANNKTQSQKGPDHCEGVAIHMTPSSMPGSASSNTSRFGHHQLLVNLSTATHEELSFARLMAVLCIGFVVCWMPQMISILISQLAPTSRGGRMFSRLADVLTALHFTLDPYIYVLLRARRRETCSRAILKVLCRKWRSDDHQPPSTPTGEATASPLVPVTAHDGSSAIKKYGRPPPKTRVTCSSIVPVVQEVSSEGMAESEALKASDVV